jgi:hypothetical protein
MARRSLEGNSNKELIMETTTTNRTRTALFLSITALLATVATGCAGGAAELRNEQVVYHGISQGDRYAIALAQTLDLHEAQITAAFDRTYPSIVDASLTSQQLAQRDLRPMLTARLEALGLSQAGLDAYAAQHPEWARQQNALYELRMRDARGLAFAIITRVGPAERSPLDLPPAGEPVSNSVQVAAR